MTNKEMLSHARKLTDGIISELENPVMSRSAVKYGVKLILQLMEEMYESMTDEH